MKPLLVIAVGLAFLSSATADTVTYSGNVTATTLGSTLTTDLPEFDGSLPEVNNPSATLTGVTITMDLSFAPYAEIFSFQQAGETFDANESVSYSYDNSIDTFVLTRGSDSWTYSSPTVGTGVINGSGQAIDVFPPDTLKLPGGNSALVNVSLIGAVLAEYAGAGTLSFDSSGAGTVDSNLSFPVFTGGGADLTGTASVTYEYIPEPATLGLLGLISGGMFFIRRRFIRD